MGKNVTPGTEAVAANAGAIAGAANSSHARALTKRQKSIMATMIAATLVLVAGCLFVIFGSSGSSASHVITITNSCEGLDYETGTKLSLQATGTTSDGASYDERFYVGDAGMELPEGTFTLIVVASPITSDGTIYAIEGAETEITVSESGLDPEGTVDIALDAVPAANVTDEQIEQAYTAAADGAAKSAERAEELRDAAIERRDEALEQESAEAENRATSEESAEDVRASDSGSANSGSSNQEASVSSGTSSEEASSDSSASSGADFECEYFTVTVPESWSGLWSCQQLSDTSWQFSYLPGGDGAGGGAVIGVGSISYSTGQLGTTSSGLPIYENSAGGGFFGSSKATLTPK